MTWAVRWSRLHAFHAEQNWAELGWLACDQQGMGRTSFSSSSEEDTKGVKGNRRQGCVSGREVGHEGDKIREGTGRTVKNKRNMDLLIG